jgi:hypothetical protein
MSELGTNKGDVVSKSAPPARLVDALTGEKAPDEFIDALAELDELHALRTRVAELEGALKLANADADDMAETIGQLIRENADLTSDLADSREARQHMLLELARAQRERDHLRASAVRQL